MGNLQSYFIQIWKVALAYGPRLVSRRVACFCMQESGSYKEALDRLRMLKPAIEHLQLLIEKGQTSKVANFDAWHALMQHRVRE